MRVSFPAVLSICLISLPLLAAGHVYNDNFSVLAPAESTRASEQSFAKDVLEKAEYYRKTIAKEWLGEELPAGVGRTLINVDFSNEDAGLTWAIDSPRLKQHTIYLSAPPNQVLGSTLAHEMVHVVLATRVEAPGH